MNEIDALVDAIDASDGLPVPTPRGLALRIIEQLARRGYVITPVDKPVDNSAPVIIWDDVMAMYRKLMPYDGPSRMPVDNPVDNCEAVCGSPEA